MQKNKNWFWMGILMPLTISRVWLLVVGWISRCLPLNLNYPVPPEFLARGWQFSPWRVLDIWGRWDSNWYLTIVKYGYGALGGSSSVQGNLAFSPLYPGLVKFFLYFVPDFLRTDGVILFMGVLISNFFLLLSLVFLYKLVMEIFDDSLLAGRTIWYLLLFPTSFFLSAFYPESLYLFLVVMIFYLGRHKKWFWVGLVGFLLFLTKRHGFLIFIPALWLYLENAGWKLKNIRPDILFLLFVPLGILVYFLIGFSATGDFWACIKIHQAWQHRLRWPWEAFLAIEASRLIYISILEKITVVIFLFFSFLSFFVFPSLSFGWFLMVYIVFLFFIGMLISSIRYFLVLFPVFIMFAKFSKNNLIYRTVIFLLLILQTLFFAFWCQFYWIN